MKTKKTKLTDRQKLDNLINSPCRLKYTHESFDFIANAIGAEGIVEYNLEGTICFYQQVHTNETNFYLVEVIRDEEGRIQDWVAV